MRFRVLYIIVIFHWNEILLFLLEEKEYMYSYSSGNQKENKIKTLIKVQSPNEFQTKTIFLHSTLISYVFSKKNENRNFLLTP